MTRDVWCTHQDHEGPRRFEWRKPLLARLAHAFPIVRGRARMSLCSRWHYIEGDPRETELEGVVRCGKCAGRLERIKATERRG